MQLSYILACSKQLISSYYSHNVFEKEKKKDRVKVMATSAHVPMECSQTSHAVVQLTQQRFQLQYPGL